MNDPLFFNKVAAAGLAALLLFFGLPQLAGALRGGEGHHGKSDEAHGNPFPQYPVEYAQGVSVKKEAPVDFDTLLATADPKAGERRAALCKSCHNLTKGGPNSTGPDLWGVVGRPVASHEGFKYTPALKAAGGEWTYDRLNKFLENSQSYIPGTAMAQHFPKAEQRAQIIAYLRTLSDNPVPLPEAKAPPAEEAPADGADAPAGGDNNGAREAPVEH